MTQRVQSPLRVGPRGDLNESQLSFRNEQGAQGAVEVLYRRAQNLGQPLGAVAQLRKTLRQGGERADFQQPIQLHRMRGRIGAVAGIHAAILGNVGWSANKRGPGCEVSHALFGAGAALSEGLRTGAGGRADRRHITGSGASRARGGLAGSREPGGAAEAARHVLHFWVFSSIMRRISAKHPLTVGGARKFV